MDRDDPDNIILAALLGHRVDRPVLLLHAELLDLLAASGLDVPDLDDRIALEAEIHERITAVMIVAYRLGLLDGRRTLADLLT